MKAIGITKFGGRDVLTELDVALPEPAERKVRIKLMASGVNPVDWKIREGWLEDMFTHDFPIILGWDAAGVVDRVGPGCERLNEGDKVYAYARKPRIGDGTYAEYICLPENSVALKPVNLCYEEAASVPLAALTAWQALFDAAGLRPNEQVLIHAAAGGVGSFAVQLAHAADAYVIGTASPRNHEYLYSRGANVAIDYRSIDFRDAVREISPDGVDVILDLVGGDTLKHSPQVLKHNGRLVSIVDPDTVDALQEEGIDAQYLFVEPDSAQLTELTALIEEGQVCTYLDAVLPLKNAAEAQRLVETAHVRGKVVLAI